MARRILVIGGTRYFGKRLVSLLLESGDEVTLATRGITPYHFQKNVRHLKVDRKEPEQFQKVFSKENFDLVFDQYCYSPDEAKSAIDAFQKRVGRYIYTSTLSIYPNRGELVESDVDPHTCSFSYGKATDFAYGDAKRFAEAAFFRNAPFPVAAMRIPLVLGEDDYTGRLDFHINRVFRKQPMVIPNLNARISIIHAQDAARFLFWLGGNEFTGAINAAAPTPISMAELMELIQKIVGNEPIIKKNGPDEDHTPFADEDSRFLNLSLARSLGFQFRDYQDWLPDLITKRFNELRCKS